MTALLTLDGIDTFYGPVQVHFGLTLSRAARPDRLPARRQRQRQVDHDEGDPRPAAPARRARDVRRAGHHRPADPRRSSARGIGSVPEARRLFGAMTVRENLLMGAFARTDRAAIAQDLERMLELFPRVRQRLAARAGTLSGGEQQMVAMARALMGRPRLLCMDEPTMGLSPLFVDRVLELIADGEQGRRHRVHGRAECQPGLADRPSRLRAADRAHHPARARPATWPATPASATPISAARTRRRPQRDPHAGPACAHSPPGGDHVHRGRPRAPVQPPAPTKAASRTRTTRRCTRPATTA